jgi:thiamine pyrophosphate-dependent acetolactate synthase large subunit-like protein
MARAFGAEGHLVKQVDDLPSALDKALAHPGPTVLEVSVAIDPPWEL